MPYHVSGSIDGYTQLRVTLTEIGTDMITVSFRKVEISLDTVYDFGQSIFK